MSDTEIVLRTPNDLIRAINGMLLQMNRPQRKSFLQWVKQKRKTYDFQYPQGYVPKEEPTNEATQPAVTIINPTDGVHIEPAQQPGIVNPQGTIVSSQDTSTSPIA